MSTCSSCQVEIIWTMTERGKRMPVDAAPDENGNLIITAEISKGLPVVRYVKAGLGDHVSHFATCPDGPAHRRR